MNHCDLSLAPSIAAAILRRVPEWHGGSAAVRVNSLRIKPGRGLRVKLQVGQPQWNLCLLRADGQVPWSVAAAETACLERAAEGVVDLPTMGLRAEVFPFDARLPALAQLMDPQPGSSLWRLLAEAGGEGSLEQVGVEPVRYKPGERCVVRLDLTMRSGDGSAARCSVHGKAFADRGQAQRCHEVAVGLAAHPQTAPLIAPPLGLVEELCLVLSRTVASARPGILAWRPRRRPGEALLHAPIPREALNRAGLALAALHYGPAVVASVKPRSAGDVAAGCLLRAQLLGQFTPSCERRLTLLAAGLQDRLLAGRGARALPGHGSFKPGQLILSGGGVVVSDLDGWDLADPAFDIGSFLAYLCPPALWKGCDGAQEWLRAAEGAFFEGYRGGARSFGAPAGEAAAAFGRASAYQAAFLLKIASRRIHRANSPRPLELAAMIDHVEAVLQWRAGRAA